jgi:hypothetical protein
MTVLKKWIGFVVLSTTLTVASGCATILRGTGQGIGIASQPTGAEVIVDNRAYGMTPVSAKLNRKDTHHVIVRMEGYEPYEIKITRQTSGWVFGNILFGLGAPVGIVIDAIAGGMYTLEPERIETQLRPTATKAVLEDETLFVFLVPKAQPEWQKIGQLQPY